MVYKSDPQRRWRYRRYYVKDRKKGYLAEAVVAIQGVKRGSARKKADRTKVVATIDQKNFQFVPETVVIQSGEQVQFLNSDNGGHNVRLNDVRHKFNVNMPSKGKHTETFSDASGIQKPFLIGCAFHSAMRAWIFVLNHPHFQVTSSDGKFRIENLPPGSYTLELHHPAGNLYWKSSVNVKAGKTTEVAVEVSPDNLTKKSND